MNILDRYLLKRFIITLLAGMFLFIFIFLIVDMTDNLSSYIDSGRPWTEIANIYITGIPSLIMLLYPVGALVALFFTVGIMVRNNEFTAVKATGVSAYRFLMPIFLLILIVSSGLVLFNEQIVVEANRINRELKDRKDYSRAYTRDLKIIQSRNEIILSSMFSKSDSTLNNVHYMRFGANNHLDEEIKAPKLYWTGNGWYAKKAIRMQYNEGIITSDIENADMEEITILPDDISIDRENTDIYRIGTIRESMESIKRSGYDIKKQLTEIYYRFSYIFVTLIIVIIGSAFVIVIKTKGLLFGLSMSILISFLYWGILQGFRASGENGGMMPLAAILIPNLIFGIFAGFLLLKARK